MYAIKSQSKEKSAPVFKLIDLRHDRHLIMPPHLLPRHYHLTALTDAGIFRVVNMDSGCFAVLFVCVLLYFCGELAVATFYELEIGVDVEFGGGGGVVGGVVEVEEG